MSMQLLQMAHKNFRKATMASTPDKRQGTKYKNNNKYERPKRNENEK